MNLRTIALLLFTLAMAGCSDASCAKETAYGEKHSIRLYSGGQEIGRWTSTGMIQGEDEGDGYYFQDDSTGRLIRISGEVIIETLK